MLGFMTKVYSVHYLRGVACLMVLISHWDIVHQGGANLQNVLRMDVVLPNLEPGYFNILFSYWKKLIYGFWPLDINIAFGGVSLFFLVSGFVISISVERQTALDFCVKRIFRIFPTLWISMSIFFFLNLILIKFDLAKEFPFDNKVVFSNAFLVADWFWVGYFDMSFWTLHVEMKFYLLFVFLIICAKKISLSSIFSLAVFIACLSLPVSSLGIQNDFDYLYDPKSNIDAPWLFYYFTVIGSHAHFLVYMLIGSVFYLWYFDRITFGQLVCFSAGLFLLFITLITISPNGLGQIKFVTNSLKALAIFSFCIFLDKHFYSYIKLPKLIQHPLDVISKMSYPLYLIHGLIGMTLMSILNIVIGSANVSMFITFCVIFPLSWYIHKYVEINSIRLSSFLLRMYSELTSKFIRVSLK